MNCPPRQIAALGVWVVCLALLSTLPVEASGQGLAREVQRVEFEGNESFSNDVLQRAIVTRATECRSRFLTPVCLFRVGFAMRRSELSAREVPRDAVRLQIWYQRRGFREVQVEGVADTLPSGSAAVRFLIDEGLPVIAEEIRFNGAEEFEAIDLLEGLPVRAGDRWSTLALDAARDTLVRRLRSRGYPHADVLRQTLFPADAPYRARVTFDVEPGTRASYGEITVEGIHHLDESTVLRTLPFRSGDPYRIDQLGDAQARLFGLDIVRSATITPDLDASPDSVVPLFVQVQEGDLYRMRGGGGMSTAECANVEARWTSRNFRGGGRVLQVRGRLANLFAGPLHDWPCFQTGDDPVYQKLTWLGAVDFFQPWIFSTRNSFNASLFAERQSVPDIFVRQAVGIQVALVRAVGPQTPLTLSYRPELSTLDAAEILLCTGFLVCTRDDIRVLTSANRLAPIGMNLTRDLSNSVLNPTRGYRLVVDLEHAGGWTLSEFRYNRAVVEATSYRGLLGSSVFAARIRGGWVGSRGFGGLGGSAQSEIVPPQKRFYAGGANSVRGFGQSRLGPRVLVGDPQELLTGGCTPQEVMSLSCDATGKTGGFVPRPTGGTRVLEGNVEVRFPLFGGFEGVTFGDVGQVWGVDDAVTMEALELTPGLGVRYMSPIGPIRVDVGYRFTGAEDLPLITQQIEPWTGASGACPGGCLTAGSSEYVRTDELVVLSTPVSQERTGRFQFHISIGQAF